MICFASRLLAAAVALSLFGVSAVAQTYPNQPIHVIVPWPPGGADISLRMFQREVEKELGQSLILENKPGASGLLGTELVARAKPDGYTLLYNITSSVVMSPMTMPDFKLDLEKDLIPITDIMVSPMLLLVRPSFPASNLNEFIQYTKQNPGKVNFGTSGSGSVPHLMMESISRLANVRMTHVVYRGFVPLMQALQGDELDATFITAGISQAMIKSGKARALAVEKETKAPDIPDLPDLTKSLPGFESPLISTLMFAPAGTPQPIIDRLNQAFTKVLKMPEVIARMEAGGQLVLGGSVAETKSALAENYEISRKIVNQAKAAGVKFD